jgi:hypothetical protein
MKINVLGSVILPAALFRCEIWSFTNTEVCMFRIVENVAIEEYFEHKTREMRRLEKYYVVL